MIKENISFWKIICKITPMAFVACPSYFIISNIVGILHGISHGFRTLMTQKFFDYVALLVGDSGAFGKVILMTIALGLALILCQILNGIDNFMLNNKENIIIGHIGKKINDKAGKLELVAFENTEYLNDIKKAKEGMVNSAELLSVLSSIFTLYLPYFIFMAWYLYKLKPILSASLIIIFIPTALTQIVRVKVFTDLAHESAPIRREYEYYESCIVDREYYKETRILGAFEYFKNLYVSSLRLLNKEIWRAEKKAGLMELWMKMITLFGYMGVLYLLVTSLLKGDISVGAFGAVFSSIVFMFSVMEEIICRRMGAITSNIGTIKNLIRFLDMPERIGDDVVFEGVPNISIDNVSFTYPGVNRACISNVSLEIKEGETIAIVGENGAGKTTLVKLMTGLYLPIEGTVFIGRVDTAKASPKSIYGNISAVFQRYQRYKMTVAENIEISSLNHHLRCCNINNFGSRFRLQPVQPSLPEQLPCIEDSSLEASKMLLKDGLQKNCSSQKKALQEAMGKADLELDEDKFRDGYETMLSREFDGVDLSGGQWQKIAIARGFYRAHNMIVLDEPTAAIDPAMETKIYRKFAEMSEGKTAIIVTHRLGSAKIANRIVVMEEGQIAEIGSHEELMNKKGKYSEMYEAQSKWYVESSNNSTLLSE